MKRTLSQAAGVLGRPPQEVERWCEMFKEQLSPEANPSKGQARLLGDSDLLSLFYVREWEEPEANIDEIRADLDLGKQYEERYQEHLYFHTPFLQDPPDELDETWRHGTLLSSLGPRHSRFELARNYRHVAEKMLQRALAAEDLYDLAFPILFTYRHTLELYLKEIGEVTERIHSLKKCLEAVEQKFGRKIASPIREWILELDELDPSGTGFRYHNSKVGSKGMVECWFDLRHFQFAMKKVFEAIDMAILNRGWKEAR